MPIREIITPENPVLRQKARRVTAFGPALKQLVDDLVETMREAPGAGLAAPQVAVSQRVIVVEYAPEPEEGQAPESPKLYRMINPEIIKASETMEIGAEGCLSLPGYAGDVERHAAVTVKGFNPQGKPIKIKAEGWLARIFQHEIDHLDGILFIDRALKVWKVKAEPAEVKVQVPASGDA